MSETLKSNLFKCIDTLSVNSKKYDNTNQDFHTHVSMIHPMGKFQMNVEKMEEFWRLYSDCILNNESNIGIAEKSQQYLPVLVDVDIKIEDTFQSFPIYSKTQIKQLVSIYFNVLKTIVNNISEKELVCFVLEKQHYFININGVQYVKNGFHLHFPYVFLDKKDHQVFLIPYILEQVKQQSLFSNLGIEDSSTLIDKQYCTVPWLMYGSHKPDNFPYKLSYILNNELQEISLSDSLREYTIYNVNEKKIEIFGNEEYYLPRILSIIPFHRKIFTIKPIIVSPIKQSLKKVNRIQQTLTDKEIIKNLEKAKLLLPLVSSSRSECRIDWMTVGWVLYNIGQGSEDALDMWIEFSKKCPEKFSESVCIYEWEHMTVKNLTLGTLSYFAKNDNPELYSQLILSRKEMQVEINDTHSDIAKQMYDMYGHEYVCASIKDGLWYKFENHHWKEIEGGIDLRNKISTDIVEIVDAEKKNLEKKMNECDGWQFKMYETGVKAITKLIKELKSHPFKINVMKECADLFFDGDFLRKLDSNRYLFGFQNGVYDLKQHVLRDGIPEDYICTQSPLNYVEYSNTDSKVQEVYDCLHKTFPDKDVFKFFMDTTSEVFLGGNDRKLVLFWSGRGNNGKSVIQCFIEKILGSYSIKFPTSLITGKRAQSSGCTPELSRAGNGVRWAVIQEPDETEYINIGVLKELSGNDTFYARSLYRSGREITPMFKLLVVCNKQPKLPHIDQATINRICVIPYESTFSDTYPESTEEQLKQKVFPKIGNFIRDKIPELAEAFLWVLLEHNKHSVFSTVVPAKVKLATEKYIQRNDYYRQFVEENIIDDETGCITINELYSLFKDWLKSSIPNTPVSARIDIQDYFDTLWGSSKRGTWSGFRIRTLNDNNNNDEIIVTLGKPPM